MPYAMRLPRPDLMKPPESQNAIAMSHLPVVSAPLVSRCHLFPSLQLLWTMLRNWELWVLGA